MSTDPSPPHLAHVLTMTRNVTTDEVTSFRFAEPFCYSGSK